MQATTRLWTQVQHAQVVKQRRATLRGRGVIVLQENGRGLAAGMDGDLPDVLIELETGKRMAEMLVTFCWLWEHLGLAKT